MGDEGPDSFATTFPIRLFVSPLQGWARVSVRVPMGFTHRYDIAPLRGFSGEAQASERGVALTSS